MRRAARVTSLALALAVAMLAAPAGAQTPSAGAQLAADYIRLLSAANEVLDAQSDFNVAKAGNDSPRMHQAAATLLESMANAAFWAVILDSEVTAENTSPEVDAAVSELRALAADTFWAFFELVKAGDIAGITTRLDASAETLNRLVVLTDRISRMTGMPRLSGG